MDYNHLLAVTILLYINCVLGQEDTQDDLDRQKISETGCKYLHVAAGSNVSLTHENGPFNHITILSPESNASIVNLTLNFGIRAHKDVELKLYSKTQSDSPYEILAHTYEYGADDNNFIKGHPKKIYSNRLRTENYERYTPNLLSPDKYVNFYIDFQKWHYRFGTKCSPFPIVLSFRGRSNYKDITRITFTAKSDNGAKILYDCPENFAGCKCKHTANEFDED